jgi:hypothetical protein
MWRTRFSAGDERIQECQLKLKRIARTPWRPVAGGNGMVCIHSTAELPMGIEKPAGQPTDLALPATNPRNGNRDSTLAPDPSW